MPSPAGGQRQGPCRCTDYLARLREAKEDPVRTVSPPKRGRVKLVLACPPKGKRAFVSYPLRNGPLVLPSECEGCGGKALVSRAHAYSLSVYPRAKVATLSEPLVRSAGPHGNTRCVAASCASSAWVRRGPTCRIRGPVRLHICARGRGERRAPALWFFSFSSLPRFVSGSRGWAVARSAASRLARRVLIILCTQSSER